MTRIIASHSAVCAEASGEARRDVTVNLFVSFCYMLTGAFGAEGKWKGGPLWGRVISWGS